MKNFKKINGVAMLPLVLLIGGLITVIALTITLTSSLSNHSSAAIKWSSEALAGAQAGVDDGIIKIIRDNSHSGASTLAIGNANVTVTVSSTYPIAGKDTITSCGVVRSSQRKLQAIVNIDAATGQVNIESIQEIATGENCPSASVVLATVPSVPQSLSATPGNTQIVLNWSAPSSNGGSSITNYKVYRGTTSGGEGGTPIITLGNILTYTNTSLTNGTTYYYKVSAVNSVGEGSQSSEVSATPAAPAFCTVVGDKNTHTTLSGQVVYCDNSLRMWTPTIIPGGTLIAKTWGSMGETILSCIGRGLYYPACDYCDGLTYAGLTGWQLPTKDVLASFWTTPCGSASCGSGNAGVSWDTNAQAAYYYSSTEFNSSNAWYVYFNSGYVSNCAKSSSSYVRCVRGQ